MTDTLNRAKEREEWEEIIKEDYVDSTLSWGLQSDCDDDISDKKHLPLYQNTLKAYTEDLINFIRTLLAKERKEAQRYKGKLKREWYMRGVKDVREECVRILEEMDGYGFDGANDFEIIDDGCYIHREEAIKKIKEKK